MISSGLDIFDRSVSELVRVAASDVRRCLTVDNLGGEFVNVLSYSGGKDSTAMYLLLKELGIPGRVVFADTGWEHPATYRQVEMISQLTGGVPVEVVSLDSVKFLDGIWRRYMQTLCAAGVPVPLSVIRRKYKATRPTGNRFLDLAKGKGMLPSMFRRFCTEFLKINPIRDQIYQSIWDEGKIVVSWQGVRRQESRARSHLPLFQLLEHRQRKRDGGLYAFRPLIDWRLPDVWAMHDRHQYKRNELYDEGANRVGCFPCIMSSKAEIAMIARRYPERIDLIEEFEGHINEQLQHSTASFFNQSTGGGASTIRDVVNWATLPLAEWQARRVPVLQMQESDAELSDHLTSCDLFGACE